MVHPGPSGAKPLQHVVDLGARGRTVVWDWPGPTGAPVLVLLHGVALDAEVNWFRVCPTLSADYRVLALDLRGHGKGLPATGRFGIEECADDVAATVRSLGVGRVVAVGYSMGGMVAQLLWRRHQDLVAGLVLCATARNVTGSPWERIITLGLPWVVVAARWMLPTPIGADAIAAPLLDARLDPAERWQALSHMRRVPLAVALDAIHAACRFTSHDWIGEVDVPSAVLITGQDHIVAPQRQRKLASAMSGSTVVEIDGDHGVFLDAPDRFAAGLLSACAAVTEPTLPTSTTAA